MQNITLITVGSLKEKYLRDAVAEYSKRLTAYCRLKIIEINEERLPDNPSDKQILTALSHEAARIQPKIPHNAYVAALCIEGKEMSSPEFSHLLEKTTVDGYSDFTFIIGGSFGIDKALKDTAKTKISFSKLTFPHQLFRVMFLEQLYRGYQISNGGKYHK